MNIKKILILLLLQGLFFIVKSQNHTCAVLSPDSRVSCESWWEYDTDAQDCNDRGCCWNINFGTVDWCYYPNPLTEVKTVHVVQGAHLDVGFAQTAPDIINLWFHDHFSQAYIVGKQLEAMGSQTNARLSFTVQSWLVSLFMNCPPNYYGVVCPNSTEIQNFKESVSKDWITWHAFPFNTEPEIMDPSLISFALNLTHQLDDLFQKPRKTVLSQRDVPGMTRSIIPILKAHGITAISVGTNGGSAPPNVPPAFIWEDPVSGERIRTYYLQGGYGGINVLPGYYVSTIVPGSGDVLIVDWGGDNGGPPSVDQLLKTWFDLHNEFPGSNIVPSTFDNFTNTLLSIPDSNYPVISAEIGDTWIHGVASDPIKLAKIRRAEKLRTNCVNMGQCDFTDSRFWNFSRLFLKNAEHTWGLDMKMTLQDYKASNWSNTAFQSIRNTTQVKTLEESWVRQREMALDTAVQALENHPLATAIQTEWDQIVNAEIPTTTGFINIPTNSLPPYFNCGRYKIGFNPSGGISLLQDTVSGVIWQDSTDSGFAQIEYQTYDSNDYNTFLLEYNYLGPLYPEDDVYDFDKVGIDGIAKSQRVSPTLDQFWYRNSTTQWQFILQLSLPSDTVTNAGAPKSIYVEIGVPASGSSINITLQVFGKTTTRLPEAMFFKFNAKPNNFGADWKMQKLGLWMDPLDTHTGGSRHLHSVSSDGVLFNSTSHALQIIPLDSPLLCWGVPSSFPTPIRKTPDLSYGPSFILWDNVWGTNYIMWFPFLPQEQNIKWEYTINFT